MLNKRTLLVIAMLVLAVLLAACGPAASPTPEPIPTRPLRPTFTPTPVPSDTPTPIPPTPTPADTPTPVPSDTPTSAPPTDTPEVKTVAVVSGGAQINVRSGPGTAYPVQGQVAQGTELEILSRNDAGDWWQVCCVNGQEVWVVDRLVTTQGDTNAVEVAANIAPPPPTNTPRPRPPTNTPAPTATPAPVYAFDKFSTPPPRPNSNAFITFFALLWNRGQDGVIGEQKLIVEGPLGRQEATFGAKALWGNPGLDSQFIYNAKVEFSGTAEGAYRAWVADPGGNQVAEEWVFTVSGTTREFFPRWKQR